MSKQSKTEELSQKTEEETQWNLILDLGEDNGIEIRKQWRMVKFELVTLGEAEWRVY